MSPYNKLFIFLLRVSLGVLFLYAGYSKLTANPAWSAAGYLTHATTFPGFYAWLADPSILPMVNFLNMWGLTLIGLSLILGIFARFSSLLGALMMLLYYFPALQFPFVPSGHAFLVDEHIIYAAALLLLASLEAGRVWGLDSSLADSTIYADHPQIGAVLG
jgi:thiosulfate dehydrogenase [quinone] large subunit